MGGNIQLLALSSVFTDNFEYPFGDIYGSNDENDKRVL